MKRLCIYHRVDLDGQCSAAIVRRRYHDVELYGWNYGDPIPWDRIEAADEVILVDVSLQPWGLMDRLLETKGGESVVWIDHHKTALEAAGKLAGPGFIRGLRRDGTAACELTWEYLYPDEPIFCAVWLLGRWDVWAWPGLPERDEIETFQFGMRCQDSRPENDLLWGGLMPSNGDNGLTRHITEQGRSALTYRNRSYAEVAKLAFEAFLSWQIGPDLHVAKFLALNTYKGSERFNSVWADHPRCVAMMPFIWNGATGMWEVSLYSDRGFDCSTVAKAYGGGGHAGAAGFQCRELPFRLDEVTP